MKTNIPWAAGLFEGEGCITTDHRTGATQLSMNMCDHDVMLMFAEAVGYGNVNETHPPTHKKKGWSTFYRWTVSKQSEVRRILSAMLPHLGNRRAHRALDALDNIELN